MAVIKKFGDVLNQNLASFGTFLVDTNPNSEYFKITEFKDTFTGGKNGFLIEGSEHLKESTEIKIQILDVEGNPVYYEPGNGIPEYYEGVSKLVAVYVYEDTPIGEASITILGELKTYVDEGGVVQNIPDEWKNIYNVKWQKTFKINRLLSNEDKVRFYRKPKVNITEIVKPIFNNVTTTIIQTGSLSGTAQIPQLSQSLVDFILPTNYLLSINDNTNWTGSIVGTTIEVPSLGYSTLVDNIISNKNLLVSNPYTQNGLVANFTNEGYTASFNYSENLNNLKTALTGSFAKIILSDLETFVGDCARVKIFRKSQSDVADYQFIQEIRLESNEILRDLESQIKNEEFYGIFDITTYKDYWVTSSNSLVASFDQSFLYNSIRLNGIGVNSFFTTKSLDITKDTEYTFSFNVRLSGSLNTNEYLRVFLSGSRETMFGNVNKTLQIQQNILTLPATNNLLQKTTLTQNIKADELDNAKLYFEASGSNWYISDVSLRASQETSFSPNEITFIQSVPRSLPEETFLYRFEFYDINNNFIPVLVEASKTFNGGNLQRLQKGLVFNPRFLQFQFDSGSTPLPPLTQSFSVTKNLLTGSVTFTSQSFDSFGNELFGFDYTASATSGGGYPGYLSGSADNPFMIVDWFTGSRSDVTVQFIRITGECEGFTDTVVFSRVLDGFGGVNYLIRPYRGTQIRNSSTASLEIQAVRVDGINDIELSSTTKPEKGWPDIQLHILSSSISSSISASVIVENLIEKFVNLEYASSSGYVMGLFTGSLGSGEINYNAVFNRDSIDTRRTIYLMSSASAASGPAFITSASVLTSLILEDLQDGLDTPVITFNTDTFNIDPRNENLFRPTFAFATASFYKRGTTEQITASFQVFPSMSINKDWVPEYWLYYTTQSVDLTISVQGIDEARRIIPSGPIGSYLVSPLSQSKNLTLTFTYTEPYTSASIAIDKTFTIVPQGTPGDEPIIFEVNPVAVTLSANSRGIVNDYSPSITEIKVKQGSRYLSFTGSLYSEQFISHGTFHISQSSIISSNITGGLIYFDNNYTESLIISASSGFANLNGSITYPLIVHPYFTSSIYTASVVQQYTKVLDGAPPIEIIITPINTSINADEVGFVTPENYSIANTRILVKEGDDFLLYNTSSLPGTWKINTIRTENIRTGSLVNGSTSSSFGTFNRFDFPFVSASATYDIQVFPFSLGANHEYTSSIFQRAQTFTKNVSTPAARSVDFKASSYTINYDRDGVVTQPEGDITLTATAFNTTGSVWFRWYFIDTDGSEVPYAGPDPEITPQSREASIQIGGGDAAGPGEIKTWKVKIWDGDPDGFSPFPAGNKPIRAEAQLTITGVKGGADAYRYSATNLNTSITADLWNTQFTGSGIQISAFKGTTQLNHTSSYVGSQEVFDYLGDFIGNLGFYSASIFTTSSFINISNQKRLLGNPASISDIIGWNAPAINSLGEVIYKIDYENGRQVDYVTQSLSVQFTPPSPYDAKLQNENSAIVYRVSGEIELDASSNIIRVYRGNEELTNVPSFTGGKNDAYGKFGFPNQCRVSVLSHSGHITLGGGLTAGSHISGNPAIMPPITAWLNPENNPIAEIVYQIDCEYSSSLVGSSSSLTSGSTLIKTQSLSITYEGNTGPGIIMRGIWNSGLDYIGSVETVNQRRDAVIWPDPAVNNNETHYWAAVSGSGPSTLDGNGNTIGAQQPDGTAPYDDSAYWQYLGQEDFFVSAKIAIFEESFVKNTINVGVKDNGTSAFANIVIAGGRPDPYIAIGQTGTAGTAGTSGTSPIIPGVIGYSRPGIFLGVYEDGANGTTGRFSIKTTGTSGKGMFWDGDTLTIVGAIRQREPGVPEGSFRGAWAAGVTYYPDDTVTYSGASYINSVTHTSTNDTNINTGFPPNATNSWTIFAAAGTSGTSGQAGTSGTSGAVGAAGAGVVYRGNFNTSTLYFHTADRRDIVQAGASFYITNNTGLNGQAGSVWGTPPNANWSVFGAQFSSVATDILLAQDATITRGLVMGTEGAGSGFIRSAGATDLLGSSGTSGFYLQTDGQFRFGNTIPSNLPSIYWNNSVLTIRGRIITDENQVSRIGNWNVNEGRLEDDNEAIVLNPNNQTITINESGTPRVIIKEGLLSNPAGAVNNVIIDPPSITVPFPSPFYGPGFYSQELVVSQFGGAFTVPAGGGAFTINPAPLNWGTSNINIQLGADNTFDGDVIGYLIAEIWDSADFTGNLINSFLLAQTPASILNSFDTEVLDWNDGFSYTLFFNSGGTYYAHLKLFIDGPVASGGFFVTGNADANSQTFSTTLDQTEIGRDGMLVIADNNNYAKIQRTNTLPIIDIKTTANAPALQITNSNTSGRAIEVLDGDIFLSGTAGGGGVNNNNLRVLGGWIGTDNTTAGIRFGTDNTNSVLIGANWPSQVTNVATARLRPGTPKLGITGRELIFDSSTIRIKTDIEDYPENAYESIKKLKPVLYTPLKIINSTTYETDGEEDYTQIYPMPNPKEYIGKQGGFIAEWLDSDPELRRFVSYGVSGSSFTTDSLAYDKLVVPLTKAVQILMNKVEAIEAYISSSK